ncbi:MAG: tRNA (adenosine(37)-N6)-dimethylallyltransferase MiaA [Alphaproteobacteria bacterium]|nr:tRNA (adenosine(37)-N6)-dimethylallyltransferase MiaA [Alphaproteobacteria bacterium]
MPKIKIITGPTASGKSSYAIDVARGCNGVIINADSMQLYKDLPILTAQPSEDEQEGFPHKLYSILDSNDRSDAVLWAKLATAEINECFKNGQTPVLVGGTGFYLKALIEGLSPIPEIPIETRHFTEKLQIMVGNPAFHELLKARDPEIAEKIHPHNTQRLVHAWEVLEATGKPLSYWQSLPKEGPDKNWKFEIVVLLPEREKLYRNIDKRFDIMLNNKVMNEVIALYKRVEKGEVEKDANIIVAHGYRALRDYHLGLKTIEEAREIGTKDTRHYAKRQFTWFRNQIKKTNNIESVTYLEV